MDNILEINEVSKHFTGHTALDNVSLSIPRGSVYGLLGPNGAGKTTLIRIINHITAPDSGTVTLNSHILTADDVKTIGYLPEERGLYKKMTVGDQALFFARLKGLSKKEAEKALHRWFEKLEIDSWWNRKVEELSKGMAQKVQFVLTVLHEPELLIFDEPFSGFDPINADILKREILELRDKGATVIFSTHNMGSVEELCDNMTLINQSRNVLTGNVAELRRRFSKNQFKLTYLGSQALPEDITQNMLESCSPVESDSNGYNNVIFNLKDSTDIRTLIARLNENVEIRGFNEILPSINDIFIQVVKDTKID
ncbi:MAG: ATP-binding cassette domain-containing protein [Muribaculaceae bacterium]|nr:ATP-binding cassette domain-containing protein [Muribaculaceae bacterium]